MIVRTSVRTRTVISFRSLSKRVELDELLCTRALARKLLYSILCGTKKNIYIYMKKNDARWSAFVVYVCAHLHSTIVSPTYSLRFVYGSLALSANAINARLPIGTGGARGGYRECLRETDNHMTNCNIMSVR